MSRPLPAPVPDAKLFDLLEWPVVFVRFPELGEPDRSRRVLNGLDALLDRASPFVLVWIAPSHGHENEPHEDEKRAALWMKRRRADLASHCVAYLYLTTDPAIRARLSASFPKMERALPFPKILCATRAEALGTGRHLLQGQRAKPNRTGFAGDANASIGWSHDE